MSYDTDSPHIYRVGEHARFEGRRVEILEVIPSGLRLFYRAQDVETEREHYLRPSQLRPVYEVCPECDASFRLVGETFPAHTFCGQRCPGSGGRP